MSDTLTFVVILVAWFVFNRWVLPRLGIPTCMSGACDVPSKKATKPATPAQQQTSKEEVTDTV